MGVIGVILLVFFVIICILLVCLVLLQNEEGGGIGGLFGGANSTAFGSRSGNILTKTTYIFVALFFVVAFSLALINKAPAIQSLDESGVQEVVNEESGSFWVEESSVTTDSDVSNEVSTVETAE